MAVWQFRYNFIPRNNLLRFFGKIPALLTDDIAEDAELYRGVRLPTDLSRNLDALGMGAPLNWNSDSLNFGDYDLGSHLTIYDQGSGAQEVSGRLHAGEWDESFVRGILAFAIECDCVLLTHNDTVIEPEYDILLGEVMRSGPYRFCNDPLGYLNSDEVKEIDRSVREKIRKWLPPS